MVTSDLDVAGSSVRPKSRLRSEINELPSEVPLVLWHVLVQSRRQSRVIPGRGLCVVVDEINTSCRSQPHFPPRGQRTKRCHGLWLYSDVVSIWSQHSEQLLTARIDPGCCTRVMINKVCAAFRCKTLFPASRQRPCPGGRGASSRGNARVSWSC